GIRWWRDVRRRAEAIRNEGMARCSGGRDAARRNGCGHWKMECVAVDTKRRVEQPPGTWGCGAESGCGYSGVGDPGRDGSAKWWWYVAGLGRSDFLHQGSRCRQQQHAAAQT